MTKEEMIAALNQLRAENKALLEGKAIKKDRTLSCKVSTKGAVSVYGFGRFPVTLYKSQWIKLFAFVDQIKAFITENDSALAQDKNSPVASPEAATEGTQDVA